MDFETYQRYLVGTYVLEEQKTLNNITATLLPKMKKEKIKEKIGRINRSIKDKFNSRISRANAEYLARQQLEQGSNNG